MSSLSQFGGSHVVISVVNGSSSGGVLRDLTTAAVIAKSILSGALTATVLATALNIAGRGALNFAAVAAVNATSRTMRLRITLDSVVVFDATSSVCTTTDSGIVGVGAFNYAAGPANPLLQQAPFQSSCLVEIASSLTETNFVKALLNYELWA